MPIDIDFVNAISNGSYNPYQKNWSQDKTPIIDDSEEANVQDNIEEEIIED